jgi:V8-like Glu-specific endopeptidase
LIGNPAILSRIAWQARGVGARKLIVPDPKSEFERARNRRVDVVLSNRISALFPILVKRPGIGYGWTVAAAVPGRASREAEYQLLTFPEPRGVIDSRQVPYKWICSLIVDFGPEVLPGPIVTGRRIGARATGTLISNRHVLTAGHALLTQGPPTKNIFGESKGSTSEALSVTVIPGRDGGKAPAVEPAGRRQAIKTRVSPAWKQSNATNRAFDYGLITLDQPVSSDYGFWSSGQSRIVPLSDPALKGKVAHCSGYPGELCPPPDPTTTVRCDQAKQDDPLKGTVQYQMSGNVSSVSAELLETEMHILEGHSGSPTWLLASNGAMNMVGIASASRGQVPEVAVRIRSAILDNLRAWISQDGVRPAF